MILADTSAWVEYDRATGSTADLRLRDLIAADGPVAVTEPVIMEVLAGARTDNEAADAAMSIPGLDWDEDLPEFPELEGPVFLSPPPEGCRLNSSSRQDCPCCPCSPGSAAVPPATNKPAPSR